MVVFVFYDKVHKLKKGVHLMRVEIKDLEVQMELKTKKTRLDVYDKDEFLGKLFINSANLIWCQGKTQPENGVAVSWKKFIAYMNSNPNIKKKQ